MSLLCVLSVYEATLYMFAHLVLSFITLAGFNMKKL